MQPLKIVLNTINNNHFYRRFAQNPLVMNWGWLFSFSVISIFNGWMISVSQVDAFIFPTDRLKELIVIYFAIFPLAATIYIISKNTTLLVASLIGSRAILAVALCYLQSPPFSPLFMGFIGFNICL